MEPHDATLVALANQLIAKAPNTNQNAQMLVAWRPDRRFLAAVSPNYGSSAQVATPSISVSIYDTHAYS